MTTETKADSGLKYQVSPLIDIIFLLIIYFMVTASLMRKEADLAFSLPSPGIIDLNVPMEVAIQIVADGSVNVEGICFPRNDRTLQAMSSQLAGMKSIAAAQNSSLHVTIIPHRDTLHRRVIDVMDACRNAGVEKLGFGESI
jgi:biopolymer transport protein ExbD